MDESSKKYELDIQQNMELQKEAENVGNSIILALRDDLKASQQEVSNKNEALDDLHVKLEDQMKQNEEFAEKIERKRFEAEDNHRRKLEQDQKLIFLEKLLAKERQEINICLQQRIDAEHTAMADREALYRVLVDKMDKIDSVYKATNQRLADDASIMVTQEKKIKELNQKIFDYEKFVTLVREREEKLVAQFRLLEKSVGSKHHQGQRAAKDIVQNMGKLLAKQDVVAAASAVPRLD